MLERSHAIFERVRRGEAEAWAELEKELVLEFEYTSWPILSDETLNRLIQVRPWRCADALGCVNGRGAAGLDDR